MAVVKGANPSIESNAGVIHTVQSHRDNILNPCKELKTK